MPSEHVRITGAGGVTLDGAIRRPVVPAGVKVPVVIYSSPYFGNAYPSVDDQEDDGSGALNPTQLVSHGFAVLSVSVRGTGGSGGCFTFFGKAEQSDQVLLVEAMAKPSWSNGRVGMMGASYDGTTPLEAAVNNPPALKTIIAGAPITDLYSGLDATPGGAFFSGGVGLPGFYTTAGLLPSAQGPRSAQQLPTTLVPPTARLCNEVAANIQSSATGGVVDERPAAFYRERNLLARFPKIRTSVLFTQNWNDDEYFSDEVAFQALGQAPKRFFHAPGPHGSHDYADPTYRRYVLAWLDFWLKGIGGVPEGIGGVRWQSAEIVNGTQLVGGTGRWYESRSWPPEQSHEEALYLSGNGLRTSPSAGSVQSFRSAPTPSGIVTPTLGPGGYTYPKTYLCPDQSSPVSLTWVSPVLTTPLLVAGNARALLRLSSDQPGGLVSVELLDLSPELCDSVPSVRAGNSGRLISFGMTDLRFSRGNFRAEPFPTGTPTEVRVDLHATAQVVPAGRRLAVLVRGQNPLNAATPYAPTLTLYTDGGVQATQLVLPVVGAGLGGSAPRARFPRRPFDPLG